jgi:asparagine N-glycosylation enzyme membrane subunit Stt3
VVQALLYAEWKLHGPVLLLGILVVYFVVATMLGYIVSGRKEQGSARRLRAAFEDANGRILAVVLFGNIVALALNVDKFSSWFSIMTSLWSIRGQAGVAEMQGLSLSGLLPFQLFVIPMVLGIYVAYKKGGNGAVFTTCWFLSFLVFSLFVGRVITYAIAAACLLSGIGLDFLWQWSKSARNATLRRAGVWALLGLVCLISFSMVPYYAADSRAAVDEQWQGALTYIRDSTPQDSVVMTQWSWGYWILDLGNRTPVVDNGYYNHGADRDRDVALVYMATAPSEAVRIMKKYGADYLIFSKLDVDTAQAILSWAGLDKQYDTFPKESLVVQCLEGGFQGGGGLQVVYRSTPDSEVVILGLTSP